MENAKYLGQSERFIRWQRRRGDPRSRERLLHSLPSWAARTHRHPGRRRVQATLSPLQFSTEQWKEQWAWKEPWTVTVDDPTCSRPSLRAFPSPPRPFPSYPHPNTQPLQGDSCLRVWRLIPDCICHHQKHNCYKVSPSPITMYLLIPKPLCTLELTINY